MDDITFQPAAGAHGEFTGLLLIKSYHEARGDKKRNKIIIPDAAHGTNPASASTTWATATVRGGKGLMQIEMYHIKAHIAGPYHAHNGMNLCSAWKN